MSDLPAGVLFATVTGWLTQATEDSVDLNRDPDMTAMKGAITFTPDVSERGIRIPDALPQPMTVFPKPIACILDDDGFLLGPDLTPDVILMATGDLIPSYTVYVELVGVPPFSLTMYAPPGTIVDLTKAIADSSGVSSSSLRTDVLVVPQGTSWEVRWPILNADATPANLAGWSVRAQARSTGLAAGVLYDWNAAAGNASIIESSVSITLSPEVSSAITWDSAAYDVELFNVADGQVTRVSQGVIRIDREVTR